MNKKVDTIVQEYGIETVRAMLEQYDTGADEFLSADVLKALEGVDDVEASSILLSALKSVTVIEWVPSSGLSGLVLPAGEFEIPADQLNRVDREFYTVRGDEYAYCPYYAIHAEFDVRKIKKAANVIKIENLIDGIHGGGFNGDWKFSESRKYNKATIIFDLLDGQGFYAAYLRLTVMQSKISGAWKINYHGNSKIFNRYGYCEFIEISVAEYL